MTERVGPFKVKYELGHSYEETWERSESHCPVCGERRVWVECGEGDYYDGPMYMCEACGSSGCKWYGDTRHNDWQDKQRLAAIRGHKP